MRNIYVYFKRFQGELVTFLLILAVFFLSGCSVNNHKVRVDDIVAFVGGKSESKIYNELTSERSNYIKSLEKGDSDEMISKLKAIVSLYEKLFFIQLDEYGTSKSKRFFTISEAEKKSSSIKSINKEDAKNYFSYLCELIVLLSINDFKDEFSFYLKKLVSNDLYLSKAFESLDSYYRFTKMYDTWYRFIEVCSNYYDKGMVNNSIFYLEKYLNITKDFYNSIGGDGENVRISSKDVNYFNMLFLSEIYLEINNMSHAESQLKLVVGSAQSNYLKIRSQLLLSKLKLKLADKRLSIYYLNQAVDTTLNSGDNFYGYFLSSFPTELLAGDFQLVGLIDISKKYLEKMSVGHDLPMRLPYSFRKSPLLSAAYIFFDAGLFSEGEWCLGEFETNVTVNYGGFNDLPDYLDILFSQKKWEKIQHVLFPQIMSIEKLFNDMNRVDYPGRYFKRINKIYSSLARSLLEVGFVSDLSWDNEWPDVLGERTQDERVAAFKLVQLSKSRKLLGSAGSNLAIDIKGLKNLDAPIFELKILGDKVFYFFYHRGSFKSGFLEISSLDLLDLTQRYRFLVNSFDSDLLASLSRDLVYLIFKEVLPDLRGLDLLYLSPDSFLTILPFSSLFKLSGIVGFDTINIVYTPSSSILFEEKKRSQSLESRKIRSALLMGDPLPLEVKNLGNNNFSMDNNLLNLSRSISLKSSNKSNDLSFIFERIPFTEKELKYIENKFIDRKIYVEVLLRENLSKDRIMDSLKNEPQIIHFASHAVISNEIPYVMEPSILLSGRGRLINYFLTSREIEGLDLKKTSLVILSACNTGVDVGYDNEGVSGLAKSFLSAGAGSIIMTLWSVDDKATSKFMEIFYSSLLEGYFVREAFWQAQNTMYNDPMYNSPFFWSAFVLYGGN